MPMTALPPSGSPASPGTPGTPGTSSTTTRAPKASNETIKETFESIVIAFVLAFVFRAFVVEAFVIPTGSMAPTLLGQHARVHCPECGYDFTVDPPRDARTRDGDRLALEISVLCPMCQFPTDMHAGQALGFGDRILVHKFIYAFTEPARWDVVVFKNPQEPYVNFIKRLVGLPGESLAIIEGNVFTKPALAEDKAWKIARKTDRPKVQRDVWQPIYHSQFVPLDSGQGLARRGALWQQPWVAQPGSSWDTSDPLSMVSTGNNALNWLSFDFAAAQTTPHSLYAYNQLNDLQTRRPVDLEPIEDVRIGALVEPQAAGVSVQLNTTCRLDDPQGRVWQLEASIDDAGQAKLIARSNFGQERTLAQAMVQPLKKGHAARVELWYADQQASFWIDGVRTLVWEFDALLIRPSPAKLPAVNLGVRGQAVVREIELDRDIYYTGRSPARSSPGLGVLEQVDGGLRGSAVTIGPDQFFCMGDNSPYSHDSRFWDQVNPWIEFRMFEDQRQVYGMVPRKLMMGRAFFVYFPAPLRTGPPISLPVPNFGKMRFIH